MNKPQRSLEDIAAHVYDMAGKPPIDERRKHQRTPLKATVKATIQRDNAPPMIAVVRDLSRGGMGLLCPIAIRRGESFSATVNFGAGLLKIACKSASCRVGDDNRYIVGAFFAEIERLKSESP